MHQTATWLLMYAVLPLLIVAGFVDWLCHRSTEIETTSGLRENLVHWLMFAQVGSGIAAVMIFEVNTTIVLWVGFVFLLHEVTVWLELRYTVDRREVRPIEQVVHSFMEMLPLVAFALLFVIASPSEGLRLRRAPLPEGYVFYAGIGVLLFNVLPLAEETIRCLNRRRAAPRR
ncbi:diguanylate cyclase [Ramlibacter albus]|uniref:Diguanylate cyclase n=1 Tax=Ramlibacter albus TaxID=2079448 RepID=A0A923S489_9BURK|nr:diguanylate cyclase [Ramlibacter albus]MBC5763882.1 diguanylate cyclase [Ramlibacter albus]